MYSRSTIQNIKNRRFWTRKNEFSLLNLMNNQPDIDNIYLSAKYLYESKYKYVINKRKTVGLIYCDDPKAFI